MKNVMEKLHEVALQIHNFKSSKIKVIPKINNNCFVVNILKKYQIYIALNVIKKCVFCVVNFKYMNNINL